MDIGCEEAQALFSGGLDAGLAAEELSALCTHVCTCQACRTQIGQLLALEEGARQLKELIDAQELTEDFTGSVMAEIHSRASLRKIVLPDKSSASDGVADTVARTRRFLAGRPFYSGGRVLSALAGLVAGMVLVLFLQWPPPAEFTEKKGRFKLVASQINYEAFPWHHQRTVAPGHTVQIVVRTGHAGAYHIKFQSDEEATIQIIHHVQSRKEEPNQAVVHRVNFKGVRYAVLEKPRQDDVIVIWNRGTRDLTVYAHTVKPENAAIHPEAGVDRI